jgi:acyl transferase domain-containing protein/acyl carrier protein
MFSGQGSQHVNMGAQLYLSEPLFRKHVDQCAEFLIPYLGIDLKALLYPARRGQNQPGESDATAASALLEQTRYAQPALFVIEYALARLWMSWGIRPEVMIGHSIGEYVAACLAGVFSVDDALRLVAARGRLMQAQPPGAMLAAFLPEHEVERFLTPKLSLAAVNGPSLCTISGPPTAIQDVATKLATSGVECRRLHTSHAFHSWMMEPVLDTFTELVGGMELKPPRIPILSNLTGTWMQQSEATDPAYWAKHLRSAVRFGDGLQEILREPSRVLLEVGPGHTLITLARQVFGRPSDLEVYASLPHVQDESPDDVFLHATLGRLWLAGVAIDWNGVHSGERRHRVALPTYPFDRKRYWVEPGPAEYGVTAKAPILSKKTDIAEWLYIPAWKQVELSRSWEENASTSCTLLFVDQCGLGEQMLGQLARQGQRFVAVRAGEHFASEDGNNYTLKPDERQHYDLLFQHLLATNSLPDRIVHLWSVTSHECLAQDRDFVTTAQQVGFFSLLYTAQAIGELQIQDRLDIAVVSNNMQNVSGDEVLSPEKATVLGPCKVIPQEYLSMRTRSIDIVLPTGSLASPELVRRLLAEFPFDEPSAVIAYRGRHRWSQSYQPLPLAEPRQAHPRLRENGVYLITGGLGGIGLVFAEYLATAVKARLVLTGRTSLPPKSEWDQWLQAHPADDSISEKIMKVRSLEALGTEVMVVQADAADPVLMEALIARIMERFDRIDGVIHAAGIPGGGMIQMRSRESATQVLSPKVEGTLLLDRLLRDKELDFFVLCSSINAIYGGLGNVDYCAANAFLDAYASACAGRRRRLTVSINWDPWQEIGMAANMTVPLDMREGRKASLRNGILPHEGIDALRRILGNSLPQVVVSTQDLLQLAEMFSHFTISHIDQLNTPQVGGGAQTGGGSEAKLPAALSRSATYVATQNEEERILAEIWQELLGVDAIGSNDNFFELGGHSLLATRVLARIQDVFKVRFSLRTFFESPTVAELAKHIQTILWAQQGAMSVSSDQSGEREELEL